MLKTNGLILLILALVGCDERKDYDFLVQGNVLDSLHFDDNGDDVYIQVFGSSYVDTGRSETGVLLIVRENGTIHDIATGYFEDVVLSDGRAIRQISLSKDSKMKEAVVASSIRYSTFGAVQNYVIWKDTLGFWNISKADYFFRGEIEDVDSDGVYELVDYLHGDSTGFPVYRFRSGSWYRDTSLIQQRRERGEAMMPTNTTRSGRPL